jgi:hypothetical protein
LPGSEWPLYLVEIENTSRNTSAPRPVDAPPNALNLVLTLVLVEPLAKSFLNWLKKHNEKATKETFGFWFESASFEVDWQKNFPLQAVPSNLERA